METSFVDSQLFAIIIGILLTTIATSIGQLITIKKEERLFDKEQKAKEKEWQKVEEKNERENIRNIYKNTISALSTFMASERQREDNSLNWEENLSVEEKIKRDAETHKVIEWISLLILRHPSNEGLKNDLNSFISSPNSVSWSLRNHLLELMNNEDDFFQTKPKQISDNNTDSDTHSILFIIDSEFRKKKFVELGLELKKQHSKAINIREITASQRKKIIPENYTEYSGLKETLNLKLPIFSQKNNKIRLNGRDWNAKLNPLETDIKDIISSWEKDFDDALEEAEKQKKEFNS